MCFNCTHDNCISFLPTYSCFPVSKSSFVQNLYKINEKINLLNKCFSFFSSKYQKFASVNTFLTDYRLLEPTVRVFRRLIKKIKSKRKSRMANRILHYLSLKKRKTRRKIAGFNGTRFYTCDYTCKLIDEEKGSMESSSILFIGIARSLCIFFFCSTTVEMQ